MKSLGRTDIAGLTIINNERHLPPSGRAVNIFGDDVIEAASAQDIGVMRAADLYRLARGAIELGWPSQVLLDRFWSSGRLDARPTHYFPVGTITNVFAEPQVIAVELRKAIDAGRRIGFELPLHNVEVVANSMQQDRRSIGSAPAGAEVAIHVGELALQLKAGMTVFNAEVEFGGSG